MTVKLSSATLAKLPPDVARPRYSQADLSPGIVHFGVGNFHRAHQAVYLDDLFNSGAGHDWGIVGAGVLPSDAAMREKLRAQDYLTTVVEEDNGFTAARITAPMIDFLDPTDRAAIVAKLADPAIRIVSLTITEGGYFLDSAGQFNVTHPDVVHDGQNASAPRTVFGLLLAGLAVRRKQGAPAFTVMSCDNIPGNGHVTENAIAGLAALSDSGLSRWVTDNVAFPNSMVDRITPATTDQQRSRLSQQFGIEDNWPVFCEPFRQWVMEDRFPQGRPELEKTGVTFVDDVAPYELMKIRILNGGHAAIAYPAALMDIHFVHEAMENDLVAAFLGRLESEEIIPTVGKVPGVDLADYYRLVAKRFANPRIGDTIRRLCLDGSNRQPKFIVPTVAQRLKQGRDVSGLALVSALWCRYCFGTTDSGAVTEPNDPAWGRLQTAAKDARADPMAWLGLGDVYGDVAAAPAFRDAFASWLASVWKDGARQTLTRYVAGAA
jgi:mannitol 2-dehydrogenase